MPVSPPAVKTLDREFLGIRCRLIDLAATMDRIDRAGDCVVEDARRLQIRRSLEILLADTPNRVERIQAAFSLP